MKLTSHAAYAVFATRTSMAAHQCREAAKRARGGVIIYGTAAAITIALAIIAPRPSWGLLIAFCLVATALNAWIWRSSLKEAADYDENYKYLSALADETYQQETR